MPGFRRTDGPLQDAAADLLGDAGVSEHPAQAFLDALEVPLGDRPIRVGGIELEVHLFEHGPE
jgi:hypothetical protein